MKFTLLVILILILFLEESNQKWDNLENKGAKPKDKRGSRKHKTNTKEKDQVKSLEENLFGSSNKKERSKS